MTKFVITPLNAGYSSAARNSAIAVQLDGGLSRTRADILNPASVVTVSWVFNTAEYNYYCAFVATTLEGGALPFEIDLVIDSGAVVEYTAKFMPGSAKLTGYQRGIYYVSAELEVNPVIRDAAADAALVAAYNAAHGA